MSVPPVSKVQASLSLSPTVYRNALCLKAQLDSFASKRLFKRASKRLPNTGFDRLAISTSVVDDDKVPLLFSLEQCSPVLRQSADVKLSPLR